MLSICTRPFNYKIYMYFCLLCNNLLHSDHHTNPWASSNFRAMTSVFLPCGHNGLMVELVNKILWYYPLNETFSAMYYFFSTLPNVKYINTSCIIFNEF